ncbi:MAG: hypothetical protein C0599_06035 [Salinivirgaceae bacterium]|nr:MAG: hypothetical protein C0599_06035 [Salinivirgaceae bacterium]
MRTECYFCHIKTIEKLVQKLNPAPELAQKFIFSSHDTIAENRQLSNPELAAKIHRNARTILDEYDLYEDEKKRSNKLILDQYDYWKNVIQESPSPLQTAIKLAVVGNVIDYGAHSVKYDIISQIEHLYQTPLKIDQTDDLIAEIESAKSIMILGDNSGEIVFDRLLIETMGHSNVTYVVRGKPVINDVTLEDAKQVGIDKEAKVISNGSDAPSTILTDCDSEFVEQFKKVDLIISKGMGNYEGLMHEKGLNIFHLLITKCHSVAEFLKVERNSLVVKGTN